MVLWDAPPAVPIPTVAGIEQLLRDAGLGSAVAVYGGPAIPDDPGPMLVVAFRPGLGFTVDGLFDALTFQVRTVGPQGDYDAAQTLAWQVDRALTAHRDEPLYVGDAFATRIGRGGGPAADRTDDAWRTHFVCTYSAEIETPG